MGYIYKVTNTVNGKLYIGQTSRTVDVRWKEHLQDAFGRDKKRRVVFHDAIRKYGKDAFLVEQIEECDSADLDKRERYWIEHYRTHRDGYNADFGGRSNKGHPVYQYALDGTFLREFETLGDAQEVVGGIIMLSTKQPHVSLHGYLWRRYKVDKLDVVARPKEKPVHQYSIEGNYITTYSSLSEAAIAVRNRHTGAFIGVVCRSDRQYAYGYRWSFRKMDHLNDPVPSKHYRKVIRISPDSGEEKIYPTITAAAKENNVCTPNIIQVCNGKNPKAKGYYWKYYDEKVS